MKGIFTVAAMVLLIAASPLKNGYEVGDTATDFKLKNIDGKMVSLADYTSAKGFIVIFDCNMCPYSQAYNDRILALNQKYSGKGFPLIAINANTPEGSKGESLESMNKRAKKKGYTFPYLVDETQEIAKTYGATNTPHVFVLNRMGKELKVAYIGTIDDNPGDTKSVTKKYVEDAVDALLQGKQIPTVRTRAIGCGIKWKDS